MPIPSFNKLPPEPNFNDIAVKVNTIVGELTNIMLNLDSLNVVSLTADHIDAGTIDANIVTIRSDLTAGAYIQIDGNGMVINNGSINTFVADINGDVTATSITLRNDLTGSAFIQIDNTGMVINNGTIDTFEADINGEVTATGITLINDLTGTGSVQIDNSGITVNNGTIDTFTVDTNGDVTATGITLRNDLTGGAYIEIDPSGMTINDGSVDTFSVDTNGDVVMTSATIRSLATGERVELDSTGLHTYDAFGFERLTIGTAPVEGVKAITFRDTTGAAQSVMTYDTETVDGSSRTGMYVVGPNAQYILLSDDGDVRIQNDQLSGFRAVSSGRPEINSGGGGWESIAFKSEVDLKATAGASTSTDGSHNHGIPNGTVLMVDGGGTVTFVTSGSHSHTQT